MKKLPEKLSLTVFILLVFFSVSELKAQQTAQSPAQAVQAASDRTLENRLRSSELERVKREADRDLTSKPDTVKRFPEIKEDFERIQTINLDSMQNNILKQNPDYKAVGKAAVEIRKRATRLRENLFPITLPESDKSANKTSDKNKQPDLSTAELKTLSVALDNAIYRFTSNNMFQNISVVNINDSNKAQNELSNIIKICSLIEDKARKISN